MPQPIVFISYSQKDEAEKETLLTHLGGLQREGLIESWSDDQIGAGADWERDIKQAIGRAKVAILLVTANFLNSEFIIEEEIPALLDRRDKEELLILPVIAKACAWKNIGWLREMAIKPKNGRPVWGDGGSHVDEDLAVIAGEVAAIAGGGEMAEIISPPPTGPPAFIAPNPFTDQGCIDDPARFFDREEILDRIFVELAAGRNISLVGEAQVGKSSLLKQIIGRGPARLQRPPADFVYLDMQTLFSEAEFFEALSQELGLPPTKGYRLRRALGQRRVILCLDEFEKMNYQGFSPEVRAQLRGLGDGNHSPLTLLLASRSPLNQLFPDQPGETSPLAPICPELAVGNFPPPVARAFLRRRLAPGGLKFTPPDEERLLAESRGHPGQLQQLAYQLYHRYVEEAA